MNTNKKNRVINTYNAKSGLYLLAETLAEDPAEILDALVKADLLTPEQAQQIIEST
jgi:hypothetical protein